MSTEQYRIDGPLVEAAKQLIATIVNIVIVCYYFVSV